MGRATLVARITTLRRTPVMPGRFQYAGAPPAVREGPTASANDSDYAGFLPVARCGIR